MSWSDVIKKSVLEGFSYSDFSTIKMVITLGITFLVAVYIFFVYRFVSRSNFYNKEYNISMAIISVVTAGIVMAMQSNLVISLGMVGALSIVRFRTAIKEPMDLLFLFWSIGTGIICGASLYEMAIFIALVVTMGLLFLQAIPVIASPYLLIVKSVSSENEQEILSIIGQYSPKVKIDSKSITDHATSLILEVKAQNGREMVDKVSAIKGVVSVTLMHHDGEVKV